MKKILVSMVAAASMFAVAAEETSVDAAKEAFAAKAGGLIEKPGTSTGRIVFINTQSEMNEANIQGAIKSLGDIVAKYPVFVESDAPDKPAALKAKHNADIAIVIVAEDDTPALLSAPEENWAVVNVRALTKGLKTDTAKAKFFDSRCRKEIMRGFACAAGGIGSSFPGNIMNITKVADLDLCDEFIPFDKVSVFKKHLKDNGVSSSRFATYRIACREGWAPEPTNDVQRVIWEKTKAEQSEKPTNPIKIKPGMKPNGK